MWESARQLTSFVKQIVSVGNNNNENGLDYNYITPALLALGKIRDSRLEDLMRDLHEHNALIWNLSDKLMSTSARTSVENQVLGIQWATPAQFSQVPSLHCILENCYSIKAWLDLSDNNIAIVHCADGKRRTGILIACYLKYITMKLWILV